MNKTLIILSMIMPIILTSNITSAQNRITSNSFIEAPPSYELEIVGIAPMPRRIPGEYGEKQYWLDKGLSAPFPGILFNPEAVAFILSEYQASYERSVLAITKQRDLDLSKLNLEVGKLKVELETTKSKNEVLIKGRDDEIKTLQKINKEQQQDNSSFRKKLFIGLGSGIAGLLIGFVGGVIILH